MQNHVEDGGARYVVDSKFKSILNLELKNSVKLIKNYLDSKGIKYNYHVIDELLNK